MDLALALEGTPGIELAVLNPKVVCRFAETLPHSKTDPADALVLLEYARRMPWQRWQPPSAVTLALRAITRRLAALTQQHTREVNRLHAAEATETVPPRSTTFERCWVRSCLSRPVPCFHPHSSIGHDLAGCTQAFFLQGVLPSTERSQQDPVPLGLAGSVDFPQSPITRLQLDSLSALLLVRDRCCLRGQRNLAVQRFVNLTRHPQAVQEHSPLPRQRRAHPRLVVLEAQPLRQQIRPRNEDHVQAEHFRQLAQRGVRGGPGVVAFAQRAGFSEHHRLQLFAE